MLSDAPELLKLLEPRVGEEDTPRVGEVSTPLHLRAARCMSGSDRSLSREASVVPKRQLTEFKINFFDGEVRLFTVVKPPILQHPPTSKYNPIARFNLTLS